MKNKELIQFRKKVREAVANYIGSEGCSCCQGSDHGKHGEVLGKILNVAKYKDGSGMDFYRYKTKIKKP